MGQNRLHVGWLFMYHSSLPHKKRGHRMKDIRMALYNICIKHTTRWCALLASLDLQFQCYLLFIIIYSILMSPDSSWHCIHYVQKSLPATGTGRRDLRNETKRSNMASLLHWYKDGGGRLMHCFTKSLQRCASLKVSLKQSIPLKLHKSRNN